MKKNPKKIKKVEKLKRKDTMIRILDATISLMGKYGYKGTTTRKIAAAAGVNEVTIFRYFKNKHAIMQSLLENAQYLSMSQLMADFFNSKFLSLKDYFDKFTIKAFESFIMNKDIFLMCLKDINNDESEFARMSIQAMRNLVDIFNKRMMDLAKKEKLKKRYLTDVSNIYHSAMISAAYWYIINEKKLSKQEVLCYMKNITQILLYGIMEKPSK